MFSSNIVQEDLLRIINSNLVNWKRIKNKTVYVTGANGMIGSYLCMVIAKLNDMHGMQAKVIANVRNLEKARAKFTDLMNRDDFSLQQADLNEINFNDNKMKVDFIIHAASQTAPSQFTKDPVGTLLVNAVGTEKLLRLARDNQVESFLFTSTREVYGENQNNQTFVREDDYGPINSLSIRSCYPISKQFSEACCIAYKNQYSLNCKIARIAHTYGPGMTIGDGRVVGDFIADVVNDRDIKMNSDGSGKIALTYIVDIIIGLYMLLLNETEICLNIADDESVMTIRALAEKLEQISDNHSSIKFSKVTDEIKKGYLAHPPALLNSDLIKKHGWNASTSIDEGLNRTVKYYKNEV